MPLRLAPAVALLALAACSFTEDDPPPVGTFEVEVTGDLQGAASGTATLAPADSSLNATTMEWFVYLPVSFAKTSGDSVSVSLYVSEPREPNGSFTEIPEGTFAIVRTGSNPILPIPSAAVRVEGQIVRVADGSATFRHLTGGAVEGSVEGSYAAAQFNNRPPLRGRIALRFVATDPAPAALATARHQRGATR